MELEKRIERDKAAGQLVRIEAQLSLYERQGVSLPNSPLNGSSDALLAHDAWSSDRRTSLENIVDYGFHAMMEVVTQLRGGDGKVE